MRAPAGRQRFNRLGALDSITHDLITVSHDTYSPAESQYELLQMLADLKLTIPITLFLNNARYQTCALVIAKAASLNIELCFWPTYSPNLNSIERLWKFVKKQCLYFRYYTDFASFKAAIVKCLNEALSTHKTALGPRLNLKFRRFQKSAVRPHLKDINVSAFHLYFYFVHDGTQLDSQQKVKMEVIQEWMLMRLMSQCIGRCRK